jgi:multidrug resistance efflux pump
MKSTQRFMQTIKLAATLIAGGMLLSSLAGCLPVRQVAAQAPEPPQPPAPVIQGKLLPRLTATLSLASGARANQVLVKEGQQVSAGDVLVKLDGHEQVEAELASAELEVILAQQEFDRLYQDARLDLAQAGVDLADAKKEQAIAEDQFGTLSRPLPDQRIEAARANMLLAERKWNQANDDLDKARRILANKKHPIWTYLNLNPSRFKLRITMLEAAAADAERHFWDSKENYEDLLAYPDEIDLELANARLEQANSRLSDVRKAIQDLSAGPDPDLLEAAQARLRATQANREAVQVKLRSLELVAPISGVAAAVNASRGEWLLPGIPLIVLADFSEWQVESDELKESLAPSIAPGQRVRLQVQSLPDLLLEGRVDSLSQTYREDDGDIFYTIKIDPLQTDSRLRWGMTVDIDLSEAEADAEAAH